jgi:hypothetical protein
MFHKSHNIPNCVFCWNHSSFCWHNFLSTNRIHVDLNSEVDQQKFVEKIRNAWRPCFYTNILCVTWSVPQVSYGPAV